jgi:hypothetical protein
MRRLFLLCVGVAVAGAGCFESGGGRYGYRGDHPPPTRCGELTSCGVCTAALGCGWCTVGSSGRCAADPDECSSASAFSWTWDSVGCPGGGADGGAAGDGGADASASAPVGAITSATADRAMAGPGVSNLLRLTYVAASDGVVAVSASGMCTVTAPWPVASAVLVSIETSPTAQTAPPGAVELDVPFGGMGTTHSFAVTRTLPAVRGANTVYLNIDNPATSGTFSCDASMTAIFSADHPLP